MKNIFKFNNKNEITKFAIQKTKTKHRIVKEKRIDAKPKKEKKPNKSIPPPQMPTNALLLLEQIKNEKWDFSLDHIIKLEDLSILMNSIHVPVAKQTPRQRLDYLKTMNLSK